MTYTARLKKRELRNEKLEARRLSECVPAAPVNESSSLHACSGPSWLREYARFHESQRCNASAPLLIFDASNDKMRCTYLGDKFFVINFALRAAALLNRVLYIKWKAPCGLPTYFEPVCIDWRLHLGVDVACYMKSDEHHWFMDPSQVSNELENGTLPTTAHALRVEAVLQDLANRSYHANGWSGFFDHSTNRTDCARFMGNYRWPGEDGREYSHDEVERASAVRPLSPHNATAA